MAAFTLVCSECGARYGEREVRYVCPACSRLQEPGGATRGVLEVELERLPSRWPRGPLAAPQALAQFLPVVAPSSFPSFAAGGTPLLPVPRLREALSMPRLWVKDDTRNPSGSTKDRASLLVAAKAREYGCGTVAAASTGNAGTAIAAVAAAAGLRSVVFAPAAAPTAKLAQIAAYGACLLPIDGSYDQAFELCLAACARFGWYNRNTAYNPFTIEGKKTAALEIARALRPAEADVVVVPVGDGVILAGVAKGFRDLVRAGLLRRAPRLIAVQAAGSAAIARALAAGGGEVVPVVGAHSVADSLVVAAPRNALLCLREVRDSSGGAVIVSDEAILDALALLASTSGVFAEPAGAAALAGLRTARAAGLVDANERVVLLITGHGLKDVASVARAVTIPAALPAELDAVAAAVGAGVDEE